MTDKTRVERRFFSTAAFLAMMAVFAVPWATAQTQPHPRAKPATPAASVAAGTSASAVAVASVSAPLAASSPVPPPRADIGDGGVRPSPLNPTAEEMPGASASAAPAVAPVDYDRLLGDIAALRARVADVGDALFVSRIVLSVQTDGDHAKIGRLTVALDDGIVYTAPPSFRAEDPAPIYEHAVAPGHHAVTVEVDRKDDRDDTFRDTQKSRFIVDVPKDSRLAVTLRVGDDSDIGAKFAGDHRGKYDVRVRMKVAATAVKR
jgi:hypothetical protein